MVVLCYNIATGTVSILEKKEKKKWNEMKISQFPRLLGFTWVKNHLKLAEQLFLWIECCLVVLFFFLILAFQSLFYDKIYQNVHKTQGDGNPSTEAGVHGSSRGSNTCVRLSSPLEENMVDPCNSLRQIHAKQCRWCLNSVFKLLLKQEFIIHERWHLARTAISAISLVSPSAALTLASASIW